MIKNEEYIDYLKKIISCISNGDYYAVKELSILTLDNLKKETTTMEKELNKYIKTNKCQKKLKNLKSHEITYFVNEYIEYLTNRLTENRELKEIASIEEFIQEIK